MAVITTYILKYKINKHSWEVLGTYFVPSLAYGIRKKLLKEKPDQYHKSKLFVTKIN